MIDTSIEQLVDVLAVEERVHRDLRQLLTEERECMLNLDAQGLYEHATRKQVLADEGRLAEGARIQAARVLAQELGIEDEPVTLRRLCAALGERGAKLREAQSRLLAIVTAAQELADANRVLGGERLTNVQTTLRLLGRLAPARESGAGRLVRTNA